MQHFGGFVSFFYRLKLCVWTSSSRWEYRTVKNHGESYTQAPQWVEYDLFCIDDFTPVLPLSLCVHISVSFLLPLFSLLFPTQLQCLLMRSGRQLSNSQWNGHSISTHIECLHPVINSYWLLVAWGNILHLNFEKLTSLISPDREMSREMFCKWSDFSVLTTRLLFVVWSVIKWKNVSLKQINKKIQSLNFFKNWGSDISKSNNGIVVKYRDVGVIVAQPLWLLSLQPQPVAYLCWQVFFSFHPHFKDKQVRRTAVVFLWKPRDRPVWDEHSID